MDMKKRYQYLDLRRIREYESNGMGVKSVIIDGIPPSTCIFCHNLSTSIDFDMDLHLYENHKTELFRLSIAKGLYFSLDSRIEYTINEGRKVYHEAEAGE